MFRNPVTDLIVVAVVALLILGPKRLPMLGRSLGQGLREFKEGITGDSKPDEEDRPALAAAPSTAAAPQPTPAAAPAAAPVSAPAPAESAEASAAERSS